MRRPNARPPAGKISKPVKSNQRGGLIPPPKAPKHPVRTPTPNKRGS